MPIDITYGGAFFAGLLSFLTPCILPMVPFYLSYMAGLSVRELRDGGEIAPGAQARLVRQSILFALGVTTIFVLLGMVQLAEQWLRALFGPFSMHLSFLLSALIGAVLWPWFTTLFVALGRRLAGN